MTTPISQGFGSAAQVPASYFERRKRVRVRIAKIVEGAAVLPHPGGPPKSGHGRHSVNGGGAATLPLQDGALGGSDGGWRILPWVSEADRCVHRAVPVPAPHRTAHVTNCLLPGTRSSVVDVRSWCLVFARTSCSVALFAARKHLHIFPHPFVVDLPYPYQFCCTPSISLSPGGSFACRRDPSSLAPAVSMLPP